MPVHPGQPRSSARHRGAASSSQARCTSSMSGQRRPSRHGPFLVPECLVVRHDLPVSGPDAVVRDPVTSSSGRRPTPRGVIPNPVAVLVDQQVDHPGACLACSRSHTWSASGEAAGNVSLIGREEPLLTLHTSYRSPTRSSKAGMRTEDRHVHVVVLAVDSGEGLDRPAPPPTTVPGSRRGTAAPRRGRGGPRASAFELRLVHEGLTAGRGRRGARHDRRHGPPTSDHVPTSHLAGRDRGTRRRHRCLID